MLPAEAEHLLALQRRAGAVVGADAGVLEHRGELSGTTFRLVAGKTNVGLATGLPPSCLIAAVSAETCVGLLFAELFGVSLRLASEPDRLALDVVEVGLEVLERRARS